MKPLEDEINAIDGPMFPRLPPTASHLETFWYGIKNSLSLASRRRYKKAILDLVEEKPGCSLLDLGCEDCKLTVVLAKKAKAGKVVGIDLNEGQSEQAWKMGITKYLSDLNGPFPLEEGAFDLICASHILEHLSDTDNFLREIYRVLIPGGYLLVAVPNLASWHTILCLVLGFQPGVASVSDELDFSEGGGPAHRRLFTHRGLITALTHHGFTIDTVKGTGYYPLVGGLDKLACTLDRHHSVNIITKARKV